MMASTRQTQCSSDNMELQAAHSVCWKHIVSDKQDLRYPGSQPCAVLSRRQRAVFKLQQLHTIVDCQLSIAEPYQLLGLLQADRALHIADCQASIGQVSVTKLSRTSSKPALMLLAAQILPLHYLVYHHCNSGCRVYKSL